MIIQLFQPPLIAALATALMVLAGCSTPAPPKLDAVNIDAADLSGAWELDRAQSDSIQAKLDSMVRELQYDAQRRAQARKDGRGGPVVSNPSGTNSGRSILALAQMAEYITRSQLLDIEQGEHTIDIKREEDFALSCEFYGGESQVVENPLGSEICGWDQHQLIFWILLPEGLRIHHRFSIGPKRERLNVATTIHSGRVTYPFTLNRVYNRYDPQSNGISCEVTLTRGKVCTTESQ